MPILIINHDNLFLKELQQAFAGKKDDIITTDNSLMATQLFFQHQPQTVILSVAMPNKDGFEIVKEIRAVCQETFILAISTNQLYLQAIKKLGANAVLLSPNLTTIVDSVKSS